MKVADFDYDLPSELIAQEPLANRADSRLLVLNKETGEIVHTEFTNIIDYLGPGDCMVINDTKVIPARLIGTKNTGGKIEVLLLKERNSSASVAEWEALVKPGKRLREGDKVSINENLSVEIGKTTESGTRVITLKSMTDVRSVLMHAGEIPLPPYIKSELQDVSRYQTVYGDKEGSAAAPTAGLHFTNEIFSELQNKGINIAKVTLNIGLDTFRPVKAENIEDHHIHKEYISLEGATASLVNDAKARGGRIVAVGTTSVRVIESCSRDGNVFPYAGDTGIFIYPGYDFKITDCMITNFHLPRSTLLMLVSAFAGKDNILRTYREAVQLKYRFFSFGDAMLIY